MKQCAIFLPRSVFENKKAELVNNVEHTPIVNAEITDKHKKMKKKNQIKDNKGDAFKWELVLNFKCNQIFILYFISEMVNWVAA